jgi:purine-nucleoside phosphorylase
LPPDPAADPYAAAEAAAERLRRRSGADRHEVALVLGSGWAPAADLLGETQAQFPVTELPGFAMPCVAGHEGAVRSIRADHLRALVFLGRTHLYESGDVAAAAHAVRTATAAGARIVILTNASGGLRPEWPVGTLALIRDHLNLTGRSPLVGARFLDLTNLYSERLRALCRAADPTLVEGVYAQVPGPHYETPAEVRMIRTLGGDLVGMSTAIEAIAAREAGAEVLGISLVTNVAPGVMDTGASGSPLSHADVLAAGRAAATRMGSLLAQVLKRL